MSAAVFILLLFWFFVENVADLRYTPLLNAPGLDLPVAQYDINLDEGSQHCVSFFRLIGPDRKEGQLLAVIWEKNRYARGDYRPLYSSFFNGRGDPGPSLTVKLPGSNKPLALIYSRDRELEYLHYRVVGYNGERVESVWEQDFVQGGELEVHSGIVVERRRVPKTPGSEETGSGSDWVTRINFLVPYQIDSSGELLLPAEHLQMEVGQYLTFIGADERDVQTSLQGTALHWLEEKGDARSVGQFYAVRSGTDTLLIELRDKAGSRRQLSVEVIEPSVTRPLSNR